MSNSMSNNSNSTSASGARLQGKVALVTGGASGLGRAIVERFLREDAHVVFTDINATAGQAFADECGANALFLAHDVTDEAAWIDVLARAQAHFGALDILVNNAGILIGGNIENTSLENWRELMRVNADSCFLGCKHGVLAMKASGGSIVNIASVASWLPIDIYAAYGASKGAVTSVTRASALHCRKSGYNIRVNSVHPDGIYTPMMQASAPGVDAKYLLFDAKRNKGGRAAMPEHIANAVLFLASDDAQFVSGSELRVDNAILGMGL
jgi:3(or 17)beta-hydroxysteroid dehydrogenase